MEGWSSVFVCCGGVSPLLFSQRPCCALRVWLNWPWRSGGLIIVWKCTRLCSLTPPLSPLQLPLPNYSLESVRGVRCHRPSTLSHMTLKSENSVAYWFACVRYSKLWPAFASKPAPLHTSLNGVARKFSANCARINQRVPLTERHCCICQRKFVFEKLSFVWT